VVAPIIGFAGITVAAFLRQVIGEYTAGIAKKKLASSYLVERIDNKIEKKFGKGYLKNHLTPNILKEIRELIHDELGAYSSKRDIDQLINNSVQILSNEHQQILQKLSTVESLLEKISIPWSYDLTKKTSEAVPQELLQGLLEGNLQGKSKSKKILNELIAEKKLPAEPHEDLNQFSFINQITANGEKELRRIVNKFSTTPEEINSLNTLMDISSLMIGPEEHINDIISGFVFRLIEEGLDTTDIEKSIIAFTFLIQKIGKLNHLSESDKLLLSSFLKKSLTDVNNPTRIIESFFLLTELGYSADIETNFVLDVMENHYKKGIDSSRVMTNQLKLSGRLARFLRRISSKSYKSGASLRTVRAIIKKLDKKKFVRSTHLLSSQLDRLTTEMNLMAAFFEKEKPKEEDLTELVELLQLLLNILNQPNAMNLKLKTKKKIIECMDSAYYLYDVLAIRNSWNMLTNYQLNIKSLYSPTLGNYQRISKNESALKESLLKYSRNRVQKMEKELPSPPSKKIKKKLTQ
jgi:hypothetical protein